MSIPVDFAGLNTLIAKKGNPDKNEITSITEPNYITVNASEGLNYKILDFFNTDVATLKSLHDSNDNEYHGMTTSTSQFDYYPNRAQNITISVSFSLDEDSPSGASNFNTGSLGSVVYSATGAPFYPNFFPEDGLILCILGSRGTQVVDTLDPDSSVTKMVFGGIGVAQVDRTASGGIVESEFVILADDYAVLFTNIKVKPGVNTVVYSMKTPNQERARTANSDQLDIYNAYGYVHPQVLCINGELVNTPNILPANFQFYLQRTLRSIGHTLQTKELRRDFFSNYLFNGAFLTGSAEELDRIEFGLSFLNYIVKSPELIPSDPNPDHYLETTGSLTNNITTLYSICYWDRFLSIKDAQTISKLDKTFFINKNTHEVPKPTIKYIGSGESDVIDNLTSIDNDEFGFINNRAFDITAGSSGKAVAFSALMNSTNGPYGSSIFKQLRSSQNWLTRYHNKNNIFSFVQNDGKTITVTRDGKILSTHKEKYGDILNLIETPISELHKPLEMIGTIFNGIEDIKLSIKASYSNEKQFFKNNLLNVQTSRENIPSETYKDFKFLIKENTPLKSFDKIIYKQKVFPKNKYTYLTSHRTRPNYSSKIWRDQRESRTELEINNGFGFVIPSQSFWPLDAEENFETLAPTSLPTITGGGGRGVNSAGGCGVLQNSYCLFATSSGDDGAFEAGLNVDEYLSASILYARPHTLTEADSVCNPYFDNLLRTPFAARVNPGKNTGRAVWEAGDMAGFFNSDGFFQSSPKKPFPDSYEEWAQSFRGLGKEYSIVPEFRISDHINHYLTNGFTSQKTDFLDVKGGNLNYAKSSDEDFFKIYSTTDFLKNFEIIKEDIKNKAAPTGVTLRCKAIKKFLPYEGFYPCQRTYEIAKQFHDSYGLNIEGESYKYEGGGLASIEIGNSSAASPRPAAGEIDTITWQGFTAKIKYVTAGGSSDTVFQPDGSAGNIDLTIDLDHASSAQTGNRINDQIRDAFNSLRTSAVNGVSLADYTVGGSATNGAGSHTFTITATVAAKSAYDFTYSESADSNSARFATIINGNFPHGADPQPYVNSTSKYPVQNLLTPLFSPGILFNSIKSGIACDYPIMSSLYNVHKAGTYNYYISSSIDERIKFEALLEPEKYLANKNLYSMEPDHFSPRIKTKWSGQGDDLYKLMINNFVSEVGSFFLQNEDFSTIVSLPEGDPNFGNAQKDKVYGMRLKMYRSIIGSKESETSHNNIAYGVPQDKGEMQESFTMYTRPSAFGPPIRTVASSNDPQTIKNWSEFKSSQSDSFSYILDTVINSNVTASQSELGENYEFTPPYYHGEAWADIFFKPPNGEAKKYSLAEIINNSSVEFYRHYVSSSNVNENIEDRSMLINEVAMQIPSSINMFSRGILQEDSDNITINTQLETKYRWIIQSKWETPTLNFNHISHEDLTLPPTPTSASVPIGMWHQYGRLPKRTDEGIFIQVTDIPTNWIEGAMQGNLNNTGSLVGLCGFSNDPVRIGEIKNTKIIEEAVVAVPFVNRRGFRQFFKLNKDDAKRAIKGIEESVGATVFKLTQQIDKYVFPPQFDYKRNKDIDPVAMYVFEFSHQLTKQDLADIWQNLPPKLGDIHETAEATVSHSLFAEELLGTGADPKKTENGIERNVVSELTNLPTDIQWMVFKVKKRAKSNYFEKMFERNESKGLDSNTNFTVDSTGKKTDISYNWPYDFFSMVELIKLDAEVEFSNVDKVESQKQKKLVTQPHIFRDN